MEKQIASLVIDAGNSETRVVTMLGRNKKGTRRRIKTISNHYAAFDQTFNNSAGSPVTTQNSTIFHATGVVDDEIIEGKYVSGVLADREYSQRLVRPSGVNQKFKALTTLLALHQAFKAGYESVSEMTNISISELDIIWRVAVLMPPEDVEMGAREMAGIIRSVNSIHFEMPNIQKDIEVIEGGINIMAEGLSGFLGVFLDGKGVRPGYEFLGQATTLVMDIGAGTTDLMVVSQGSPIESTKYTLPTGGNNVGALLSRRLQRSGFGRVTIDRARDAVISGLLQDGAQQEDVIEHVADAKSEVASTLVGGLKDFFEMTGFDGRSISHLLVVGGGAKVSEKSGIEPISNYLVKEMRSISPKLSLVDMPFESIVDEENEVVDVPVDTRLLNVNGAAYQIAASLVTV